MTITMENKVLVTKHDKVVMNKSVVTKNRLNTSILLLTEDTDAIILIMLMAKALTNF